ncbi:flagellar filament capping protein FliD [Thalassotalea hakodatensis]|uniref:flagellar filament capping protein FliD n=1 Tax=Thalassotalea hakodatensis TaxID=3030492 RepID=UPI002573DB45|nr:flagellar filament capping protein FliD [Thalassotalea hakodatensis]
MNITSAGVGSGLDLESIIEAFVTAESIPTEVRLQEREDRVKAELSGLGTFKSALSTFQSVADKLASIDDFSKQIISASNEDITVSTNGFASSGSFDIEVIQLAQATRIQTQDYASSTTTVGAGTLTFGAGADTFDVTIDAADDLSAIRDKINAESGNFGVTASLINSDSGTYLTYTSTKTGLANELSVSTGDAALDGLATNATVTRNAQDAIIEVDGNGNFITNDTNEFKNSIEDVTIVANNVSASGPATLSIAQDKEAPKELITEFVSAFNALSESMDVLGSAKFGKLAFDSDLRSMDGQLKNVLINTVSGMSGDIQSLGDMGIQFDKFGVLKVSEVATGSLKSGSEMLSDALENNIDEVGAIFASPNGVIDQLTTLIEGYNDSDGTLTQRQKNLNEDLTDISDEYDNLEARLRNYEDTLRQRFAFLDSTVAGYNATANWLETALKPANTGSS